MTRSSSLRRSLPSASVGRRRARTAPESFRKASATRAGRSRSTSRSGSIRAQSGRLRPRLTTQTRSCSGCAHNDDLPIIWEGGSYNPDFLAVDTDGVHWLLEPKMEKEVGTAEVKGKRAAAERWASHVSNDENAKAEWRYLLLSESDIASAKGSWGALKRLGSN